MASLPNQIVELGADREHDRERPVERQRVGPEAAQASEPRVHELKVNRREPAVISRSADPERRKISRPADGKIGEAADDVVRVAA